jgi:hypothetical protein
MGRVSCSCCGEVCVALTRLQGVLNKNIGMHLRFIPESQSTHYLSYCKTVFYRHSAEGY